MGRVRQRKRTTADVPPRRRSGGQLPEATVCALAFVALLGIYHANGDFLPGHDATPNVYLPVSLLNDGNLTFDPQEAPFMFNWKVHTAGGVKSAKRIMSWDHDPRFRPLYESGVLEVDKGRYFLLETRKEGEYIGQYGIGAGLAALPVVAVFHALYGDLMAQPATLWFAAKFAAALLSAASAVVLYLIARTALSQSAALLILCAYALGTNVWSTSSQSLWQHAPNAFFLTMGIWSWLKIPVVRRFALLSGFCFASAVLCRPTSAVYVLSALMFLLLVERRALLPFIVGGLPIAIALAAFNYTYLGSPLEFGQTVGGQAIAMSKTGSSEVWRLASIPSHAAGQLLSPSRGLLIFSPFLLFSFWGIWRIARDRTLLWLRPLVASALGVMLVTFAWFDWWGGWSYGPRLLVDTMPVMVVCLLPVMTWILQRRSRLRLFLGLMAWSIAVQATGAFAYDLAGWNSRLGYPVRLSDSAEAVFADTEARATKLAAQRGGTVLPPIRRDIDKAEHRSRLWSVSDNAISYYLTHWSDSRQRKRRMVATWMK